MRPTADFDLPPEKRDALARARRLERVTLAYLASSAVLLYFTMGGSQAMRTSFFEDLISTVPSIMFLLCSRIAQRPANPEYPYGYHGAVSIGYLTASLALVAMGAFLLFEAVMKFVLLERTTIGGMTLFGETIWAGWPMLVAVAYTAIPSVFLGHQKAKLAPQLHDKILHADAEMMKADWIAESGTAAGVIGVGLGFWWMDPLAAALVSASILKDGVQNVGAAIADLIERRPMKTDQSGPEPVVEDLRAFVERLDWVARADVRLREVGHVFFGEVFVVPVSDSVDLPRRIARAVGKAKSLNWRLHDVTITVLDDDGAGEAQRARSARVRSASEIRAARS